MTADEVAYVTSADWKPSAILELSCRRNAHPSHRPDAVVDPTAPSAIAILVQAGPVAHRTDIGIPYPCL